MAFEFFGSRREVTGGQIPPPLECVTRQIPTGRGLANNLVEPHLHVFTYTYNQRCQFMKTVGGPKLQEGLPE